MFSDHTFYEIFKLIPVLGSGKLYQEVLIPRPTRGTIVPQNIKHSIVYI